MMKFLDWENILSFIFVSVDFSQAQALQLEGIFR